MQSFTLSLPPSQALHRAVLSAEDCVAAGERLQPVERTERRERRGRCESVWRRDVHDVAGEPEGAVLIVMDVGGRAVQRALVRVRERVLDISETDAEDYLDPAGARRRAWWRRTLRSRISVAPWRHRFDLGHGYEADTV